MPKTTDPTRIKIKYRKGQLPRLKWHFRIPLTEDGNHIPVSGMVSFLVALRHAESLVARYAPDYCGFNDVSVTWEADPDADVLNGILIRAQWCMPTGSASRLRRHDPHFQPRKDHRKELHPCDSKSTETSEGPGDGASGPETAESSPTPAKATSASETPSEQPEESATNSTSTGGSSATSKSSKGKRKKAKKRTKAPTAKPKTGEPHETDDGEPAESDHATEV